VNWFDAEVEEMPKRKLNERQEAAVLRMMDVLRDPANLMTVAHIKKAIAENDAVRAEMFWSDFTEDEQNALWVAPTYGGIFTTHERKMIRGDE